MHICLIICLTYNLDNRIEWSSLMNADTILVIKMSYSFKNILFIELM